MVKRYHLIAILLCFALTLPGFAQVKSHKTKTHRTSVKKHTKKKTVRKHHGQQAMNAERVREIQAALIREKYLEGEPNGSWDGRSKAAMQRFQHDNGWQTKVVPDSRALIKLGLGPDHAGLLNPDTAAIATVPGGGTVQHESGTEH